MPDDLDMKYLAYRLAALVLAGRLTEEEAIELWRKAESREES